MTRVEAALIRGIVKRVSTRLEYVQSLLQTAGACAMASDHPLAVAHANVTASVHEELALLMTAVTDEDKP